MLTTVKAEGRYVPERLLKHLALFSECDLKVFLTLLHNTRLPGEWVSVRLNELADQLGFTQKSIRRSIARWQGFGLLQTDVKRSTTGIRIVQLLIATRSLDEWPASQSTSGNAPSELPGKPPAVISGESANGTPEAQRPVPSHSPSANSVPFEPKGKKDLLALDIAKAFKDELHLPMFRHFCQTLDEQFVRRAFSETLQTPEKDIKKSRTALFIYLIRKYAYGKTDENSGN